ncbi:hypothetical protein [Pendulispora albinea]|uniref:Uncharacterized protein n=1 Tax=Pendulispora albinea TaxID=2741071 RepID=A0ABZ2M603_9BACT
MRVGTPIWDLPSLIDVADAIVIASALEDKSSWEEGRIVTHSRVRIDRAIAGHLGNEPLWIRTKGGTIGSICQFVDGEAVLQKTWPSLLFLVRVPNGSSSSGFEIAGGAHGQFPIVLGEHDEPRAIPSPWLCVLNPIADELKLDPFASVTLDKISRDLSKSWARAHASSDPGGAAPKTAPAKGEPSRSG